MSKNIQSVLFDKSKFTIDDAIYWALSHGFIVKKVDETLNKFRFRQFNPNYKYKYYTKKITPGIEFIIAY